MTAAATETRVTALFKTPDGERSEFSAFKMVGILGVSPLQSMGQAAFSRLLSAVPDRVTGDGQGKQ
jgi:hypothetical protein